MSKPNPNYHVVILSGTTDAAGAATVNSAESDLKGEVIAVIVDGHNLSDSANLDINPTYIDVDGDTTLGADIIDNEDIGNAALNEFYPRDFEEDIAGADIEVVAGQKVTRRFALAGCGLRAAVVAGGDTKEFSVKVLVAL